MGLCGVFGRKEIVDSLKIRSGRVVRWLIPLSKKWGVGCWWLRSSMACRSPFLFVIGSRLFPSPLSRLWRFYWIALPLLRSALSSILMVLLKTTLGLQGLGELLETIWVRSFVLSMVLWSDSTSAEVMGHLMGLRNLKWLGIFWLHGGRWFGGGY